MRRREAKRKRQRESSPKGLIALLLLTSNVHNVFDYLCTRFVYSAETVNKLSDCNDPVIEAHGLEELLAALSSSAKMEITTEDLLRVTSRLQRSQSTSNKFYVAELCFAISQAQRASNTHERRRRESECEMTNCANNLLVTSDSNTNIIEKAETPSTVNALNSSSSSSSSNHHPFTFTNNDKNVINEVETENMPLLLKYYKQKLFDAICTDTYVNDSWNKAHIQTHIDNPTRESIITDQDEWERFVKCVYTPLPMSIRVHCNETNREALVHELLQRNATLRAWLHLAPCVPQRLQLYSCTNAIYHRQQELQLLCRAMHSSGGASFQELVSTLPAMVLQVEPHHRVLDMCAAPGSKTLHILDLMLRQYNSSFNRNNTNEFHDCENDDNNNNNIKQKLDKDKHTVINDVHDNKKVEDLSPEPIKTTITATVTPNTSAISFLSLEHNKKCCWAHGVVIANEKDYVKATQTLPARLKRFHAPNVLCTRCDATQWPHLYTKQISHNIKSSSSSSSSSLLLLSELEQEEHFPQERLCSAVDNNINSTITSSPVFREQRFDRILCDVPCSGDGTLRKERSALHTWSAAYVQSLVKTQQVLLRRGLDLLAVDGILVYSTCSLNPLEDENVVLHALKTFKDSVELIDVNIVLKNAKVQLHSCGGIAHVEVLRRLLSETRNCETKISTKGNSTSLDDKHIDVECSTGEINSNAKHFEKEKEKEEYERRDWEIAAQQYDGTKLLRVLPHRDDTGGFFIAAFRKVKMPEWSSPTITDQKLNQWTRGKWWRPVQVNDATWVAITDFYGLNRHDRSVFQYYTSLPFSFAEHQTPHHHDDNSCSITRECSQCGLVPVYHLNSSGGECRRIVLITMGVAEMLFATKPFKGPGVEVVTAGMRSFEKLHGTYLSHSKCRWRATMESSSYLAPRCSTIPAKREWVLHLSKSNEAAVVYTLLRDGFVSLRECGHVLVDCITGTMKLPKHTNYSAVEKESSENKEKEKEKNNNNNGTRKDMHMTDNVTKSSLITEDVLQHLCNWENAQLEEEEEEFIESLEHDKSEHYAEAEELHNEEEWLKLLTSSVEVGGMFVTIVNDTREKIDHINDSNNDNDSVSMNRALTQREETVQHEELCKSGKESDVESSESCSCASLEEFNKWYLTANLTSGKVELTIDTSLRAFGLLVYFNSQELLHISNEGNNILN